MSALYFVLYCIYFLLIHNFSKRVKRTLGTSIANSLYDIDDDYSDNNIPNYTSFHNAVFVTFKELQTLEFFYLVVSSKWKNLYNLQSLKVHLHWRKNFFKDKFEELTPDGIETTNLFCQDKIREKGRNLDDTGEPFFIFNLIIVQVKENLMIFLKWVKN